MRKLFSLITVLILIVGAASAALINVDKANYIVTKVYGDRNAFGVDLVQNGAEKVRTEVRLNKDAKCYWVHANGSKDTPMSVSTFMHSVKNGTRVRVTGGRDWDGKINASDVWGQ